MRGSLSKSGSTREMKTTFEEAVLLGLVFFCHSLPDLHRILPFNKSITY